MTKHILVIEDDDQIRKLASVVLHRAGYETELARNGREAIDALGAGTFDAVVLDLMMPVSSGFEVITFLEDHQLMDKRVVVMTAAGRRVREIENSSVVYSILHKPFHVDELAATVRRCTGDEALPDPLFASQSSVA